jgi:hypothetical protein
LEEHVFSICRVEAKQENNMKQAASRAMLEVTYSSEKLVNTRLTTEHYSPGDRTQDKYRMMKCELVRSWGVCKGRHLYVKNKCAGNFSSLITYAT